MEWFQLVALWSLFGVLAGGSGIAYLESQYDTYGLVAEKSIRQIAALGAVASYVGGILGLIVSAIGWIANW